MGIFFKEIFQGKNKRYSSKRVISFMSFIMATIFVFMKMPFEVITLFYLGTAGNSFMSLFEKKDTTK
jgi:hypothetical protein